jgi:multidrug efflux pump subunit AcrA (membrane-fusion protein)
MARYDTRRVATDTIAAPAHTNGRPAATPKRSRRRFLLGGGALAIALGVGVTLAQTRSAPAPTAPVVPERPAYDARGRIVPVSQARVATLVGGVVRGLPRQPGDRVEARDELARLEGPTGSTEVLSAPFAGTLLSLPANVGDSLLPGSLVAIVGDLSELRIETTDVDEYLIASLAPGQPVQIEVDALANRPLTGRVHSVSLLAQPGLGSRLHYPVLITLTQSDPSLRPSMTARLRFPRP